MGSPPARRPPAPLCLAVGEEVSVPPVRALVLLRAQPAQTRARQPRGDQARLSLPVTPRLRGGTGRRGRPGSFWRSCCGEDKAASDGDLIDRRERRHRGGGVLSKGTWMSRFGAAWGRWGSASIAPSPSWPCRYCTEGKRTFSSRLILEKHIQVRHGIKVTDQPKSQEVVIARIGTGTAQVRGPSGRWRRVWAG